MKRLWIPATYTNSSEQTKLLTLFSACTSLRHLASPSSVLQVFIRTLARTESATAGSHVTHLTLTTPAMQHIWMGFFSTLHGRDFLSKITHLTIFTTGLSACVPFDHLPALTHLALALPRRFDESLVFYTQKYLDPCPLLKKLVFLFNQPSSPVPALNISAFARRLNALDARLHVLCTERLKDTNDLLVIWSRHGDSRDGTWGLARGVVREDAGSPTATPFTETVAT